MHGVQRPISPQVLTKLSSPPSLPPSLRTPAVFLGLTNTCCNRNACEIRTTPPDSSCPICLNEFDEQEQVRIEMLLFKLGGVSQVARWSEPGGVSQVEE